MNNQFITYQQKLDFEIFVDEWMEKVKNENDLQKIENTFLEYLQNSIDDKYDKLESEDNIYE